MPQEKLRLGDAVNAYNAERERSRKYSPRTLKVQASVLDQFVRATGAGRWLSQCGPTDLERFFYGEEERYIGVADRVEGTTYNSYRKYLTGFEKWARYKGHIVERAPTKDGTWIHDIPPVPEAERDHRRLSEAEYYAALDAAGDYDPRDRAMMAVGMILATRGCECASLTMESLTRSQGEIKVVITKGSHTNHRVSTVKLAPALVAELDPWLDHYAAAQRISVAQLLAQRDWHLFPNRTHANNFGRGNRIISYWPAKPVGAPYMVVKRHLRTIGIEESHLGFHTLRRSGARLLYEHAKKQGAGDPLRLVQVHLNHKDRETTLKYIGLAPDAEERDTIIAAGDYLMAPTRRDAGNVVRLRRRS